jgi:DNA-binding GntR family transcriptional regulator
LSYEEGFSESNGREEIPFNVRPWAGAGRSAVRTQRVSNLRKSHQQIRDMIVHGRLAPGGRIVEADLAEHLGVSRTPVRTALHMLHRAGFIDSTAGDRTKERLAVAPLTKEDAGELYAIIGHLEGLAVRKTAQLDPAARSAVVQKLRGLNQGLRESALAARKDPDVIFDLDTSFHQAVVDVGAGPRLRRLLRAVKPQAERYWRLYASGIVEQLGLMVDEHAVIIQAIEQGDCDRAERAIQINWLNGAERLFRVIDTVGERGSW